MGITGWHKRSVHLEDHQEHDVRHGVCRAMGRGVARSGWPPQDMGPPKQPGFNHSRKAADNDSKSPAACDKVQ